ncbi:LysR family transcriptional regulator [Clostridium sp. E02]|uniref:LysR family transcriptional regulator n=1 Tax=Clostridium sp. E02 TaxID=2487134 RepID=UPI000F542346|nr:LysR family transcriptional regulator [Clostridium sp. E02]
MTIEEIKAFMAVVEYKTLTQAAEKLYISQSTISQRIKRLENELGVKLFMRQPGQRTAELTSHGSNLVPIAQQWASLWGDMYSLHTSSVKTLISIGSVDLINNFTFVPLYKKILQNFPNIELSIQTFHSPEIHSLLENRIVDIGFVFSQIKYPDIISRPVYREKMYLITHAESNYHSGISTSQLDPSKEAYLRWGADYDLWHSSNWSNWSSSQHMVTVNTGSTLTHYLDKPGNWAIGPISLIRSMQKTDKITCYELKESPPPRICHQLTHRYPKPSKLNALKLIEQQVEVFVSSNENICRFEPWMLE